jgi:hypothetical protein
MAVEPANTSVSKMAIDISQYVHFGRLLSSTSSSVSSLTLILWGEVFDMRRKNTFESTRQVSLPRYN